MPPAGHDSAVCPIQGDGYLVVWDNAAHAREGAVVIFGPRALAPDAQHRGPVTHTGDRAAKRDGYLFCRD